MNRSFPRHGDVFRHAGSGVEIEVIESYRINSPHDIPRSKTVYRAERPDADLIPIRRAAMFDACWIRYSGKILWAVKFHVGWKVNIEVHVSSWSCKTTILDSIDW